MARAALPTSNARALELSRLSARERTLLAVQRSAPRASGRSSGARAGARLDGAPERSCHGAHDAAGAPRRASRLAELALPVWRPSDAARLPAAAEVAPRARGRARPQSLRGASRFWCVLSSALECLLVIRTIQKVAKAHRANIRSSSPLAFFVCEQVACGVIWRWRT